MKILYRILFLALVFNVDARICHSQGVITEGKIVYEISFPDMELDKAYKDLNPTGSVVYFKNDVSRTELTVGKGLHTATILNASSGEMVTLTDMMGTKNAMIIEGEGIGKAKNKSKAADATIEYFDDTKEIAGYSCKKAIIKTENSSSPVYVFYTDKIHSIMQINRDWNNFNGFPLQYTLEMNGIVMMMTAISVSSEKVADSYFLIPSDYQIITAEQMRIMLQDTKK